MTDTIVGFIDDNVAPDGYEPKIIRTCMFLAPERPHGCRYYLAIVPNGASKTWLTDKRAEEILARWAVDTNNGTA